MSTIEFRDNGILLVIPSIFIPDNLKVIISDMSFLLSLVHIPLYCLHHRCDMKNHFNIMIAIINCPFPISLVL